MACAESGVGSSRVRDCGGVVFLDQRPRRAITLHRNFA